jgi:hypothetical protein
MMRYTKKQIHFLRIGYKKWPIPELTAQFNSRFKQKRNRGSIEAAVNNRRFLSGRTGCFEKGFIPWNSGTKGMGICKRNSGTFKKGNTPGNIKPMGYERISADGYIEKKIRERNPYTGAPTRFKMKQVLVWEKKYGPIPKNKIIVFLDGDQLNCRINNLELISRAEHVRLNQLKYRAAPGIIKPGIFALAKLKTKIGILKRKMAP